MITITEEQSISRKIYLHWIILLPRCVAQIASLGVPAYDRASIVILILGAQRCPLRVSALQS